MKKFAITLCLLSFVAQGAFAYQIEGKSSDIKSLQKGGYTQEALKIIDTINYQNSDEITDYQRYYDATYNSEHPVGKWYTVIKRYIDPVQEDNLFGRHEIHFTNTWFENAPSDYVTRSPKQEKAKNNIYIEKTKSPDAVKTDIEKADVQIDVESL